MWPAMDLRNKGGGGGFPGLKVCKREWVQREREREIEEKMWRGDQKGKGGRREKKGEKESLSKSGRAWSLLF